jgi:carbon storage regulator
MLVLSRKAGESLIIGNQVRIKIVEIRGGQVRIGVEAPPEISVVREELHRAVAVANRQAIQVDGDRLAELVAASRGTDRDKPDS